MRRWFVVLGVGALTIVVLGIVRPDLILVANTPTGGDMGAHVLGPAAIRDTLLPAGRLTGWSHDWFAGFPLFYFYFPLPSLVIVALDLIMPYGVAFKIVTVLGLLATPVSAVYFARSLGFGRVAGLVTGVFGGAIVLAESYTIYGGNIHSTMAGEFSYSWSFALGLFALGMTVRAVDAPRLRPYAALLLAVTALSHVLTTLMLILAMIPIMFRRGGAITTLTTWVWGFAISAFWALPLIMRIGLTADMGWRPLTAWDEIFPTELWWVLPFALIGVVLSLRRRHFVAPVLVMGVLPVFYFWFTTALPVMFPDVISDGSWKLWNGRLIPYWYFSVLFFAGAGIGLGWEALSERLPRRMAAWVPWAGIAALAWAFTAVAAVTGRGYSLSLGPLSLGVVEIPGFLLYPIHLALVLSAIALLMGMRSGAVTVGAEAGALALALLVTVAWGASVSTASGWATWNFVGYEGKDTWPEYQALMETVDDLDPGRIQWEANSDLQRFGTPMALMLFPYWTHGTHTSQEGLYFESSLTTPFHFINHSEMSYRPSNPIPGLPYATFDMERGLRHLEMYAVDYYVSVTPEAREKADGMDGMELVAESGSFAVYDLGPQELVEVVTHVPSVYVSPPTDLLAQFVPLVALDDGQPHSFSEFSVDWYADLDNLATLVTTDGPDEWPRITNLSEVRAAAPVTGGGVVSNVELSDHRISFSTTAVGVPHLVKVSYFANWQARGADGPYRSTPSLMVVIPTQEDVVLEFRNTWVEWAGIVLSVGGLVAFAGMALRPREDEFA